MTFIVTDLSKQNRNIEFSSRENASVTPQLTVNQSTGSVMNIVKNNEAMSLQPIDISQQTQKLIIFPNPATSTFMIQLPQANAKIISLFLMDNIGKQYQINATDFTKIGSRVYINIAGKNIIPGIYFVVIKTNAGVYAPKVKLN